MNFTLNQLEIFQKIVQVQSVTKAAEELFLTQPAVSIQLKNFQDQFEIPLTEVIGRKIFITDFGREIAVAVDNILSQVYEINYKTSAFKGQLSGKLKISIVSTGKYVMPFFLADYMQQNSAVELLVDVTNKSKVIESLEKNEVDFALVSILPQKLRVEKLELLQNKLFLVGNGSYKIQSGLSKKELFKQTPIIFREQGSGTRQAMEAYFEKNKIDVVKKMELTSNEAVKQALLAGLGFSVMPLIGIKNELKAKSLKIIPIHGLPIKTTWQLIWLKDKKHTPISQSFLDYLKQHKQKIIQEKFNWYEQY